MIRTVDGLDVVLDEDHWKTHIIRGHPELTAYEGLVIETLKQPDGVYQSRRDPDTRIYAKDYPGIVVGNTPLERISLRVIVREQERFVVTAYFAAASWRGIGERIWPL